MQFSDLIPQALYCRLAPNCSFFAYYDSKKIYIKETAVSIQNFAVIPSPSQPSDIAISPNSTLIAAAYKDKGAVLVWDLRGQKVAQIEDTQAVLSGMLWAPDSVQILVFSQLLYKCSIYNLSDRSVAHIRGPKLPSSKGCIFNSDGRLMALLQKHDCKDTISIYTTGDWTLVNSIVMDSFDLVEMRWDGNDSHIVAWENPINYRLYAVCPFKGVVLKYQPYDYALGIKAVDYSNRSMFVAIGSFDEKIRLLNALTWKEIAELDCSNNVISSENTKIYKEEDSNKTNNRMKLVERSNFRINVNKPIISDKGPPVQGVGLLEFSHEDAYLACRNDNMPNTVWLWNVATLELETVISLSTNVRMLKWDRQENTLCIACGADKVLFWKNGVIMECSFPMESRKFNVQRFIWGSDSKRMLLFDRSELIYADLIPNQ